MRKTTTGHSSCGELRTQLKILNDNYRRWWNVDSFGTLHLLIGKASCHWVYQSCDYYSWLLAWLFNHKEEFRAVKVLNLSKILMGVNWDIFIDRLLDNTLPSLKYPLPSPLKFCHVLWPNQARLETLIQIVIFFLGAFVLMLWSLRPY